MPKTAEDLHRQISKAKSDASKAEQDLMKEKLDARDWIKKEMLRAMKDLLKNNENGTIKLVQSKTDRKWSFIIEFKEKDVMNDQNLGQALNDISGVFTALELPAEENPIETRS